MSAAVMPIRKTFSCAEAGIAEATASAAVSTVSPKGLPIKRDINAGCFMSSPELRLTRLDINMLCNKKTKRLKAKSDTFMLTASNCLCSPSDFSPAALP